MIQNLFPIPVGQYKLDFSFSEEELSFLREQEVRPNMGNTTSVNNEVLKSSELKRLKNAVEEKINEYFNLVHKPNSKVQLKITQSWVNYTEQNQFHHKHNHNNSFISGVLYIQANKEKDKIYFYKNEYSTIKIKPEEWNMWNSESWWFDVEAKDLLLFPSSLNHMVQTVEHNETRISLAFNAFPVGFLGDAVELTLLEIKG
jgi:uncharacterized protein (TIGR02466 family)